MSKLGQDYRIRSRVIKDYDFPFNLVHSPYYEYFVELFDEDYGTVEKSWLIDGVLVYCQTVEDFFKMSENLKNKMIFTVKDAEAYADFCLYSLDQYNLTNWNPPPSNNLYIPSNVGKDFISIDLKQANFNVLHYFSDKMFEVTLEDKSVEYCHSYEEFISKFTNFEYFKQSKKFRQVIFGSLNPKRQIKIQRYLVSNLVWFLLQEYVDTKEIGGIIALSNDEIIIEGSLNAAEKIRDAFTDYVSPLHICSFRLEKVEETPYYVKVSPDGKIEIKGAPSYLMPQVYKTFKGMKINEYDRTFFYEGKLAVFHENSL